MDNILRSTGTEYLLRQGFNKTMPQNTQSWEDTKKGIANWWEKKTVPIPDKYRNAPPPDWARQETRIIPQSRPERAIEAVQEWGGENLHKVLILAVAMVSLVVLGMLALKK